MAKVTAFVWSLGSENLPVLIIAIGAVMLSWLFFLGDIVLNAAA